MASGCQWAKGWVVRRRGAACSPSSPSDCSPPPSPPLGHHAIGDIDMWSCYDEVDPQALLLKNSTPPGQSFLAMLLESEPVRHARDTPRGLWGFGCKREGRQRVDQSSVGEEERGSCAGVPGGSGRRSARFRGHPAHSIRRCKADVTLLSRSETSIHECHALSRSAREEAQSSSAVC